MDNNMDKNFKLFLILSILCFLGAIGMITQEFLTALLYIFIGVILLVIALLFKNKSKNINNFFYIWGNVKNKFIQENKNTHENILEKEVIQENKQNHYITQKKNKNNIFNLIKLLKQEKENLKNEIITTKSAIKKLIDSKLLLEAYISELEDKKISVTNDINELKTEKALLINEIEQLENNKDNGLKNTDTLSIEYIDSLSSGLEFEKTFAYMLEKLDYSDIKITSGSGDFGIDVLAKYDDILYGFQCKLYSNSVGNKSIQEAYSGKNHYNCNVAVVVTNNFFTKQAIEQAKETQVILWDRDTLSRKIKEINKCTFLINGK